MRRFRERAAKKYTWTPSSDAVGGFSDNDVLEYFLAIGSDYQQGIGQQEQVANVIRIIGDLVISIDPDELENITDTFIYGPVCWGILIRDSDDPTVYDPSIPGAFSNAEWMAIGITECIGIILDTNAQVAGTGLVTTFGSSSPHSTVVHFDVHSNRRIAADESLVLCMTRSGSISNNAGESYFARCAVRTLLKLP